MSPYEQCTRCYFFISNYYTSIQEEDWRAIKSLYAEDAWFSYGDEKIQGRDEIVAKLISSSSQGKCFVYKIDSIPSWSKVNEDFVNVLKADADAAPAADGTKKPPPDSNDYYDMLVMVQGFVQNAADSTKRANFNQVFHLTPNKRTEYIISSSMFNYDV